MKEEQTMDRLHNAAVYEAFQKVEGMESLKAAMEEMALRAGRDPRESRQAAVEILNAAIGYQVTFDQFSENAEQTVDSILQEAADLSPEERIDMLQQMLFGFQLATDEQMLQAIPDPDACHARYLAAMEANPDALVYTPEKEAALRAQLVAWVSDLRLSKAGLKRLRKSYEYSEGYVATSAAMGYNGLSLKCLVAMDLHLHDDRFTPTQAAVAACQEVDMEAIADRVHRGQITEKLAMVLLCIAYAAALVYLLQSVPDIYQVKLGEATAKEAGLKGIHVLAAGLLSVPLKRAFARCARLAGGLENYLEGLLGHDLDKLCPESGGMNDTLDRMERCAQQLQTACPLPVAEEQATEPVLEEEQLLH